MATIEKVRENRLRRQLKKHGVRLQKSRIQNTNIDNYGNYMLIDMYRNLVLDGCKYEMTLDDVENYVKSL